MSRGSIRLRYLYVSDTGKKFQVRLASDNVVNGSGLTLINPASPPADLVGTIAPSKCRRVYAQATVDARLVRRPLICGDAAGTLYKSDLPQQVSISGFSDSVKFVTTGRRGEKFSI